MSWAKIRRLENKIENVEKAVKTIEDYTIDYLELPNLNYNNPRLGSTNCSYQAVLNVTGKGYLIGAVLNYSTKSSVRNIVGIRISIDGKVIYWQELDGVISGSGGSHNIMGISNNQNCTTTSDQRFAYHSKMAFAIGPSTNVQNQDAYKIAKFSSSKINLSSCNFRSFASNDTTKVINSKGLRFEKSLKIELIGDNNSSGNLHYFYSLDD